VAGLGVARAVGLYRVRDRASSHGYGFGSESCEQPAFISFDSRSPPVGKRAASLKEQPTLEQPPQPTGAAPKSKRGK
jgi:hypothetical protein